MYKCLVVIIFFISCNSPVSTDQTGADTNNNKTQTDRQIPPAQESYFNDRFKDVTITSISPGVFLVEGRARVFEAAFSWVVEDRHNEILHGHETTRCRCPGMGKIFI